MTATTTPTIVSRYLRFWNCEPGDEQRKIAAEIFTDDVRFRAPIGSYDGPAALVELRTQIGEHLGEVSFRARTEPEFHHDRARLQWEVLRGGESFSTGIEVLAFADDGRIADVTGFFDRAPEDFEPHTHDEQAPA